MARSELDAAQVEALKRSIALADAASRAPAAAEAGTTAGASPPSPFASAVTPPRDDAEREARIQRSLPAPRALADVTKVGDGSRYVFALDDAAPAAPTRLLLFDVSSEEGLFVGEHDFGATLVEDGTAAGEGSAWAAADAPPGEPVTLGVPASEAPAAEAPASEAPAAAGESGTRARVVRAMEVVADGGEPVVLAEVARARETVACGWWLRRRGSRFVCAPRVGGASSYRGADGVLVEEWQADLPGTGGLERVSGASGRLLRIYGGRWREVDQFRCLAVPLDAALREAGAPGVGAWQEAAVRRRVDAARRSAQALETEQAIGFIADALAIDGCDAESWRLLGRLQFESGRASRAAPALAVAVALAPRDLAAMVDLADALAVLDARPAPGAEGLRQAVAALDSRGATRAVVDAAGRGADGTPTSRALARAFYAAFLERTDPGDPRLEAARRRASEAITRLDAPAQPPSRRRGARGKRA